MIKKVYAIFFNDVEITSILNKYSRGKYPREHSQNGTKFRTICCKCNNNLGTFYDISFIEFIREAVQKIAINFSYEKSIICNIKPSKVIKSLFGHLLAAKGDYEESLIDTEMRRFFLNDSLWKPEFYIFYWFHPYSNIEIVRDLAICNIGNKNTDVFNMLKMYPISFYITKEKTYNHLSNLNDYCCEDTDKYVQVPLNINVDELITPDWPFVIDDNTLLMRGQSINSSVISSPIILTKLKR